MITINNNQLPLVNYNDLIIIQNDLKDLSENNYKKLLKSLNKFGLFIPFFVWKDGEQYKVVDGTQRLRVLKHEGIKFDNSDYKVPCLIVEAKDIHEAKQKLLVISSQYGKIQADTLQIFIDEAELPEAEVFELTNFDALPDFAADQEPKDKADDECKHCPKHCAPLEKDT